MPILAIFVFRLRYPLTNVCSRARIVLSCISYWWGITPFHLDMFLFALHHRNKKLTKSEPKLVLENFAPFPVFFFWGGGVYFDWWWTDVTVFVVYFVENWKKCSMKALPPKMVLLITQAHWTCVYWTRMFPLVKA